MTHTSGPLNKLEVFGIGQVTLENGTTLDVQVLTATDNTGVCEEVAYVSDEKLAHTLAAAPELLEALCRVNAMLNTQGVTDEEEEEVRELINQAIAKAEGKG